MWWAELTAGAPSLLCQHCWSFSPSPGLLGLSAAGAEGQSMPRRRETPLEICSVSLGPSQPHSAPPPLLQPHILPQSCHGEERSPPTALLSYKANPTCPDTTQVHLFEILGDGDGAVLCRDSCVPKPPTSSCGNKHHLWAGGAALPAVLSAWVINVLLSESPASLSISVETLTVLFCTAFCLFYRPLWSLEMTGLLSIYKPNGLC